MLSNEEYLKWLEKELSPLYSTEAAAGHDVGHVQRMVAMGARITHLPDLDLDAYAAAVWLHNLDRVPELKAKIEESSLHEAALGYLRSSPFGSEVREDIAVAVATHGKKDDEAGDSSLLKALRAADKVDRLGPRGVLTSAMIHAHLPLYDPNRNPFCVELGEDGWPLTIYDDIAGRLMEWPLLMPTEVRYLIDTDRMRALVAYARGLSEEVCREHGLQNGVEDDLQKALGPEFYALYAI